MAGKYVSMDATDLRKFVEKMELAGRGGGFKKELRQFLDSLGVDFLSHVQDAIIRAGSVDTRRLLNSFQKDGKRNVFIAREGSLQIEVGSNVKYASYVNDGHWTNPKGVDTRWVPGHWTGPPGDKDARFIYQAKAKTGMLLKQKWIEGSHYFDEAVRLMERIAPMYMEEKMQEWLEKYFSDFL